jgi:excisionase family DNA binding protein
MAVGAFISFSIFCMTNKAIPTPAETESFPSSANALRPGIEDAPTETADAVNLMTVADIARQLNVSRSKIYGLIAGGSLQVHRLPAIRVSQDDLHEFLGACRTQPRSTEPRAGTIRLKHLR